METKAQLFLRRLMIAIGDMTDLMGAGATSFKNEAGIMTFTFEDGSYVDFTVPMAFSKKDA